MVLASNIFHPIKRRCMACNESKNIPVDAKPICKECLIKRKEKIIYYEKVILVILLILLLILIISS